MQLISESYRVSTCGLPHFNLDSLARSANSALGSAVTALAVVLFLTTICDAAIRAEAYRGEPFGIGRIEVDLRPGSSNVPWGDDRFALEEADGRAMYPVVENAPVRRLVRRLLGIETPWRVTFYFMFRGDEPLSLTVYSPDATTITLRPENRSNEFRELQQDWWRAIEGRFQRVYREAAYPVLVENYLASTWARRLGREMPDPQLYLLRKLAWGDPWVSQLTANENYQLDVQRALLLGQIGAGESATIELPRFDLPGGEDALVTGSPSPTSPAGVNAVEDLPAPIDAVGTEPIARHVPQECFYLRFGNFPNYLWFRDFLRQSQGDLGNMIVLKSIDYSNSDRLQQQLAVGETALARVMGPTVIADVAIIGLDYYLRDGAAMGILFHAKNNLLLGKNLSDQRHDGMAAHQDATEETIQIAGHDVSFISTPDGTLRSYYAVDGDFHLVATCRRLVERFYAAGAAAGSLAASTEFQDTRVVTPLSREDTILLFLSAAFLDNLSSPHYRVELDRRLRSIGEIRALELARLAAGVEGSSAHSIDELVAADFLPKNFGQRADGSHIVDAGGELSDSLRGSVGAMVPVADMPVDKITPTEARRYEQFRQGIHSSAGQFVPISLVIKRQESTKSPNWDHITADVRISPYSQTRLVKWAKWLGPAEPLRVAPIIGDVVSLEVIVDALGQGVHLFGGLRDFRAPLVIREGEVRPPGSPNDYLRGYVGTWPRPFAVFEALFGRPKGEFDDDGIARNDGLFELWQRRLDDFFLFSLMRDVLMEVGPQLAMVEPERPAQIRLQIDELTDKQIATSVTAVGYMRARSASVSGARFMNSLVSQLHVPPADARGVAERLVGGRFNCPLGGDYELIDPLNVVVERETGREAERNAANDADVLPAPNDVVMANGDSDAGARLLWASTATSIENRFLLTQIPADYEMPLLNWFRGAQVEIARAEDAFMLHANLQMVRTGTSPSTPAPASGGFKLPSLGGLFGGSGRIKDDQVKPAAAEQDVPPPTK
jgi:hypothetical protein